MRKMGRNILFYPAYLQNIVKEYKVNRMLVPKGYSEYRKALFKNAEKIEAYEKERERKMKEYVV